MISCSLLCLSAHLKEIRKIESNLDNEIQVACHYFLGIPHSQELNTDIISSCTTLEHY